MRAERPSPAASALIRSTQKPDRFLPFIFPCVTFLRLTEFTYVPGIGAHVVAFNIRSVSVQTPRTLRFVPPLECRFTPFSPTNSSRDSGRRRSETQSISKGACTKESGNGRKNNCSAKVRIWACLLMADTRSEAASLKAFSRCKIIADRVSNLWLRQDFASKRVISMFDVCPDDGFLFSMWHSDGFLAHCGEFVVSEFGLVDIMSVAFHCPRTFAQ